MELIYRGAEAELYRTEFMGIPVVIKRRISKGYRAKELDRLLRITRTRKEARLMRRARLGGVPVPAVIDVWGDSIMMEYVPGVRMADSIDDDSMLAFGLASCRLHRSNIAHNDLTPYNALITAGGICLLDFGLAEYTHDVESYAVDLYVLKRSLKSITEEWEGLWESFLRGYSTCDMAERVIRRLEQVEARGRYK
ncbi:MAG: Kae1-associated kinase Bud32 [Candidatus Korarchaeota archaeon NZ13-K]|nr:MAG: Kae1-associated kinase Bud32 [Candidatus Korarchaeota archaeon NZ13-K]